MDRDLCALLGFDATLSGSSVPTFRDNLSVFLSMMVDSTSALLSKSFNNMYYDIFLNRK
jgi:hypothetical protein